jgi:VIT1/CCC1 family predicted Fe2+/Mn2+ transporter
VLAAHARDGLGVTEISAAPPVQAAFASATTFGGAALPLAAALVAPEEGVIAVTATAALLTLGYLGARAGGVAPLRPRPARRLLGRPGDGRQHAGPIIVPRSPLRCSRSR